MGVNVSLTPELEAFAKACVDGGRYNNVSEVVRQALRLLQDAEERKRLLMASLEAAVAESERDGYVDLDDAMAEVDAIIEAAERCRPERG
jgi:antitoxin ParD1/3/4